MFFEPVRNWYGRYERPISSISLVLGFVFDAVTLKRVDTLWENLWILGHLLIVGVFIALIHIQENEIGDETDPSKKHFWYVNILQFFFGGILSTYLVFYFRSADIFATWPFILVLAAAFVANESLKRHYIRFSFQISLFFLSIYSFAIFVVPVILHRIGTGVFLLSGLLSLIFIALFVSILFHFVKGNINERKEMYLMMIGSIFAIVNILYFTNLIPPIPLSLKDGGVYYSVSKNIEGNYDVTHEHYGFGRYFKLYNDFKKVTGERVYVYSSVFSPSGLNLTIFHEWQKYDEVKKDWVKESKIRLSVIGGRGEGFRTYSFKNDPSLGKWRVNVLTEQGHLIGRLRFNLVSTDTDPVLETEVKY